MKKCCFALALLCTCVFAAAQSVESNLADAVTLYGNGQYRQARTLLQTLSEAAPQDDAVWYYLALTQAREDPDAARVSLEKAVALDSTNYWYRRTLVRMCLMNQQPQEALALQESLVRAFPDKPSALYDLLDIYLNQREFQKALAVLEDIRQQRGPSEELVRTQYDVYTAMGQQEEGVALLEQFNKQYSSPSVLSMLGDYYLSEFSDSLAQQRYEEALSLDSSYVPALLGVSEVYRHQRRYQDYFRTLAPFFTSEDIPVSSKSLYIGNMLRSIDPKILQLHQGGFDALVESACAAHPADTTILSTAGRYYYSTGREAAAGKWFRQAAQAHPESLQQVATYIQYLSMQEQWEPMRAESLAAYKRLDELAFLDYANMASYQLKDYNTVIANCKDVLAKHGKDAQIALGAWSMAGDAYHANGQSKEAFKAYERALRLNPSYVPVLNNYAYYLSLEGKQLKKAYTMSKKTVEAEPDNSTYLDTFGWILHLMGKDLEAKPFFKHAMLYGGKDSAVVLDHYAEVLYALGEYDMARLYWNQAKGKSNAADVPDLESRVKARLEALENK